LNYAYVCFEVVPRDISPQRVTLPANFCLFLLRYRDRGRYFIATRERSYGLCERTNTLSPRLSRSKYSNKILNNNVFKSIGNRCEVLVFKTHGNY